MKRVFFLLLLLCSSAQAWADGTGPIHQFAPPEGDGFIEAMSQVFGSMVTTVSYGGSVGSVQSDSAITSMMGIFCAAVLFVGMLFITYTTIRGFVESAADAEILGKKMSNIYVPIRTVVGSCMLFPLPSGYCMIQILVIWIGAQGIGVADKAYSAAVDQIEMTGMMSEPILPNARPLVISILRSQVCAAALNRLYEDRDDSVRIEEKQMDQKMIDPSTDIADFTGNEDYMMSAIYWQTTEKIYVGDQNVCGGITWQSASSGSGNSKVLAKTIVEAHASAVQRVISETAPLAAQIVAGKKPAKDDIEAIVSGYETAIRNAAKAAVDQTSDKAKSDFLSAAKAGGFLYAGIWANHLAKLNDSIQSAINGIPVAEPLNIRNRENEEDLTAYNDAMTVVNEYVRTDPAAAVKRVYYNDTDVVGDNATDNTEGAETLKKLLSAPFLGAINKMTQAIGGSNLNHMSQMKNFGDILVNTGDVIILSMMTAAGASGSWGASLTIGSVFSLSDALGAVVPFLSMLVFFLMSFGVMLAVWIPMVPFVTWSTALMNLFLTWIEAIVVGPIFAAAHIHPDGDDLTGKGGNGYMFILALFLRPILMLFGLFIGMVLTEPVSAFINTAFMTVVSGIQMGSLTGAVMFLGYVAVYTSISLTVVHLCYSLIHWLPDNCLRWINGHVSGLHSAESSGNQIGDRFKTGASQMVGSAQSALGSSVKHGQKKATNEYEDTNGRPSTANNSSRPTTTNADL